MVEIIKIAETVQTAKTVRISKNDEGGEYLRTNFI